METLPNTASRLTALEVKVAFAEDTLNQLNTIVYRQQQTIDLLAREVAALRDQMPAEAAGKFRSLRDELPPHY
jgi:SlyX protein